MLNFNEVKAGFGNYLTNLNEISGKQYENTDSEASIFTYANEFEHYVTDELGYDTNEISIDYGNMDDIEIENGTLIDPNDESNESIISEFSNGIINLEEVKKEADKDGDGEISDGEYSAFLDEVNKNSQDAAKLTLQGFLNFLKNMSQTQSAQIEALDKAENAGEQAVKSDEIKAAHFGGLTANSSNQEENQNNASASEGSSGSGYGSGSGSGYSSGGVSGGSGSGSSGGVSGGSGSSSASGSSKTSSGTTTSSFSGGNAEMTGSTVGLENADLSNQLIKYAAQFNGYKEGDDKTFFQGSTCEGSTTGGTPWCAAFVQYCVRNSGVQTPDWYKQCSTSCACSDYYKAALSANQITTDITQAKAGDLILFGSEGSQHIGIVAKDYDKAGKLYTIEGNHGDAVHIVDRTTSGNIAGIAKMNLSGKK